MILISFFFFSPRWSKLPSGPGRPKSLPSGPMNPATYNEESKQQSTMILERETIMMPTWTSPTLEVLIVVIL